MERTGLKHVGNHRTGDHDRDHHRDLPQSNPHDERKEGGFDERTDLPKGERKWIGKFHPRIRDPSGLTARGPQRTREREIEQPAIEFLQFVRTLILLLDQLLDQLT